MFSPAILLYQDGRSRLVPCPESSPWVLAELGELMPVSRTEFDVVAKPVPYLRRVFKFVPWEPPGAIAVFREVGF